MAFSRVRPSSRMGVSIPSSGASTRRAMSKRTWSFPAPVDPWATARAPIRRAASTTEIACWVRSAATLSGYTSPRSTFPWIRKRTNRSNTAWRASTSWCSTAPTAAACRRMASSSAAVAPPVLTWTV
jgi:hypothetical protein